MGFITKALHPLSGSLQRKLTRMNEKGRRRSRCWYKARSPQSSGRCWAGSPPRSRSTCPMTSRHPSPSCIR